MATKSLSYNLLWKPVGIYPLVCFRIIFGVLMLSSTIRFIMKGWIEDLYLKPVFHFSYYGFEYITVPSKPVLYALFGLLLLSFMCIILGLFYRISTILACVLFTYIELLDKAYYLNHYYFVSLLCFILICIPAHRALSLDSMVFKKHIFRLQIPIWSLHLVQFQIAIVYIFAGIAKINTHWLFDAMPMHIWLSSHNYIPIIGTLLQEKWIAYVFSWLGMLYDICIVFLLLSPKTRIIGYISVLIFHILTYLLFPIGMFPFIMICSTLIFFSEKHFKTVYMYILHLCKIPIKPSSKAMPQVNTPYISWGLGIYMCFQICFPLRHVWYSSNIFWAEEGYRFSWRVMLMEKAGYCVFKVVDNISGKTWEASTYKYLTAFQEKMMSTQPDMILQFTHFLKDTYNTMGYTDISIYAYAHVSLNGNPHRLLIDPNIDMCTIHDSFTQKTWILPI